MLHLQIKFGCNWTSTFPQKKKKKKKLHFPRPQMTFDLINIQRNPCCILAPILVPIGLQLFKGDPYNENQHFPPNLTSDDPWPCYVTFDLFNIWKNPYCIFHPSLVGIRLQLFKEDPNNENLTNLEHTHTYTPTHRQNSLSQYPPIAFQARGIKLVDKMNQDCTMKL